MAAFRQRKNLPMLPWPIPGAHHALLIVPELAPLRLGLLARSDLAHCFERKLRSYLAYGLPCMKRHSAGDYCAFRRVHQT